MSSAPEPPPTSSTRVKRFQSSARANALPVDDEIECIAAQKCESITGSAPSNSDFCLLGSQVVGAFERSASVSLPHPAYSRLSSISTKPPKYCGAPRTRNRAARGLLTYRAPFFFNSPSAAQPVSSISAGRSAMPSALASSLLVVPLVPDRRLNRSSSVAAAKVLKAQKAVESSIKGSTEVPGIRVVAAMAVSRLIVRFGRSSAANRARVQGAGSARRRFAGDARHYRPPALGRVRMHEQRVLREIEHRPLPRRPIGRRGVFEQHGLIRSRRQPVVQDRAGQRDLKAEAIDRTEFAGPLSGSQEDIDPLIDARRGAARFGVHRFRALHELAK